MRFDFLRKTLARFIRFLYDDGIIAYGFSKFNYFCLRILRETKIFLRASQAGQNDGKSGDRASLLQTGRGRAFGRVEIQAAKPSLLQMDK